MTLTIGLAGITGKFGRLLASKLIKNPNITLRGYYRDPKRVNATLASSPQVHLFQGEAFNEDNIRKFVKGCAVVICAYLGDDKLMIEGQKKLIDACEVEGVPRYIASDWALDYTKLEFGELFPKDPMKHVKAYLDNQKTVKGVHILIGASWTLS
ncbi:nmrA-like family protein [Colletotrichum tofieldiae]|nr:nmrA-like family protein [Colletotrichum tofieldiae]